MLTLGIEPVLPAREQPQIHTLDRENTGFDTLFNRSAKLKQQVLM
jgi:hypothetical protein